MTTYSIYDGTGPPCTVGKVAPGPSPRRAPSCHVVVRFDLYPCRYGIEDRVSVALSGPDEDVGRAIVVTLAWGTARELLVTQTHLPKYTHLSFLSRERMQRLQRWAEHVKCSMTLWRRSA